MNASTTTRLARLLDERGDEIIKQWTAAVAASTRGRLGEAELTRQLRELYQGLQAALTAGSELTLDDEAATELRGSLTELSRQRARRGFTSTETAVSVFSIKEPLRAALGETTEDLKAFVEISRFLDSMGLFTFEAYARTREELIADQAEQLLELSTPVIKLWEGVVAIPLVGTLDSARAQVVMERLLQTLVDTGSPYAIIDITGVPAVDTQVAQHILKTVVAARLMGADCVISGIRPQIAQTIVALGIEFGDIVTKASLSDALQHALRAGGFEISRRSARRA
ncbi:STAS domain-containing protein [Luedemannella helvata]|uniref:STAS domain-containing protein n=1 Tax=Luedemannella helvata TaxID=349315 RepID=A0ABP4X670_9ACTN